MSNELATLDLIPKNKVIGKFRERYYEGQKGVEFSYLLEHLSTTTSSKVFDRLLEDLKSVRICCSLLTAAADDSGETYVETNELGEIMGVSEVELPPLRRFSMMFYPQIFEATKVTYFKTRVGMPYKENANSLVLPYFVTLYAIENAQELFDIKVVRAVKSLYITNLYSALTEGIANVRDGVKALLGMSDVNPVPDVVGIMKAVTLYELAKNDNSFDRILNAVLDNSQNILEELEYDSEKLNNAVMQACRNFIRENAWCLRDIDEPDEYEKPKLFKD